MTASAPTAPSAEPNALRCPDRHRLEVEQQPLATEPLGPFIPWRIINLAVEACAHPEVVERTAGAGPGTIVAAVNVIGDVAATCDTGSADGSLRKAGTRLRSMSASLRPSRPPQTKWTSDRTCEPPPHPCSPLDEVGDLAATRQ